MVCSRNSEIRYVLISVLVVVISEIIFILLSNFGLPLAISAIFTDLVLSNGGLTEQVLQKLKNYDGYYLKEANIIVWSSINLVVGFSFFKWLNTTSSKLSGIAFGIIMSIACLIINICYGIFGKNIGGFYLAEVGAKSLFFTQVVLGFILRDRKLNQQQG